MHREVLRRPERRARGEVAALEELLEVAQARGQVARVRAGLQQVPDHRERLQCATRDVFGRRQVHAISDLHAPNGFSYVSGVWYG